MMGPPYDDIIGLPHHVSSKYPRMPAAKRAAQFAPFAALNGYEDALAQAARQVQAAAEAKAEEDSDSCWPPQAEDCF